MLPDRTIEAEDAFVRQWVETGQTDALEAVIGEAVDAGRPRLACRLVGLLPERPGEDEAVARARRAARLLLLRGEDAPERDFDGIVDAWLDVRRRRMDLVKARMRRMGRGATEVLAPHREGRERKPRS